MFSVPVPTSKCQAQQPGANVDVYDIKAKVNVVDRLNSRVSLMNQSWARESELSTLPN
jgi:hypothetical protein